MLKDKNWCTDEWTPIIKERQLIDFLAKCEPTPSSDTQPPTNRIVKSAQIQHLEELWKVRNVC